MKASDLPPYEKLPVDGKTGFRSAWGLFDKDRVKDEIGTINLLTPEVVIEAAKEVRIGKSVSLNWGLENMHKPFGKRQPLEHKFTDWKKKKGFDFYAYDDEINVNTQAGSQWDGLRHWGHQTTGLYYNGIHHDELLESSHLGIDHWAKRGGIVGRGILLDYCSWAERNGIQFHPMSDHRITVSDLEAIAKEQQVKFRPGDILIVRTGWVKCYQSYNDDDRTKHVINGKAWIGVEGSEETLTWVWDNHFAAVAGDSIGWEKWPPQAGYCLHDHFLALWGMPIGELWDLEELAAECERQKRWSFFLTSCPLNVTGGVASPPNALAIF